MLCHFVKDVLNPGESLQGLRRDISRSLAPLELDDHQIPLKSSCTASQSHGNSCAPADQ